MKKTRQEINELKRENAKVIDLVSSKNIFKDNYQYLSFFMFTRSSFSMELLNLLPTIFFGNGTLFPIETECKRHENLIF